MNNKNYEEKLKKFAVYCSLKIQNNLSLYAIETDQFNLKKCTLNDIIENSVKKFNQQKYKIDFDNIYYILSLKCCQQSKDKEFYVKNYDVKLDKDEISISDCAKKQCYSIQDIIKNDCVFFLSPKTFLNIFLRESYDEGDKRKHFHFRL